MAKKQKSSKEKSQKGDMGNEKLCAILSYLFIGIIWYFIDDKMKKSEFARYHAKQGIVLLIAELIYLAILGALFIPLVFASRGLLVPILSMLYYVPLIWVIVGIINAVNDKMSALPLIGKFAEKFSF